jgi:hypothetical protein
LAVVSDILKVIYAPHKAFKQILQNPRYLGVLVLIVIFVVVQVGSSYVIASKSYIEQTFPTGVEGDVWTENAALWQASPGVTISNNTVDYINSSALYRGGPSYFGSSSVEFTASNMSIVRMELISVNADEQVNPVAEGYENLSFRLKIAAPSSKPSNVSFFLSSLNASTFHYDLTEEFSSSTAGVWNNITIPVSSGAWYSSGSDATWENITGLKMEFVWETSSSIDLRIGGLFFRGEYDTPINLYAGTYLEQAVYSVIALIFEWFILTGALAIMIKFLKGNATWRLIMIAVGFSLVVLLIQAVVLLAIYASLPKLFYPLELLARVPGESIVAPASTLEAIDFANVLGSIVQVVVWLWLAGLGTFITREVTGMAADVPPFGWLKSIAVSGLSLLLTIIVVGFLI